MRETVRSGSKGNDVLYMQLRLNAIMNAGLTVDGDFGAKSVEAVKRYQEKKNLAVNGVCGPEVWAQIEADSALAPKASDPMAAAGYAQKIICSNEGSYGTINKNDNGALSIGELQWHSGRALSLLRSIATKNPSQALSILGQALYNEVNQANTSWAARIVNDAEKKLISSLLTTAEGKAAQDELALEDISTYVIKGLNYGLTDPSALIYFADGTNQYGLNSSLWKNIAAEALKSDGGLDAMFAATKALTQQYLDRRERVYKAVQALGLKKSETANTAVNTAPAAAAALKSQQEATVDNAIADGVLTDKTYWLNVLNGKQTADPQYIKAVFDRYHGLIK